MTTTEMLRRIGSRSPAWTAGLAMLALAGCATGPTGPSMTAMPGSQRSLEQFRYDDAVCRQRALGGSGGQSAAQAANAAVATGVVGGAAIGALAGAALGGSQGAGVGAGVGMITGSAVGAGNAPLAAATTQRAYDQNYVQCMYAAGHKVPVVGTVIQPAGAYRPTPVPGAPIQGAVPPMPPPGAPPAPPPGVMSRSPAGVPPGPGPSSSPPAPPPGTPPTPPRTWRGG
jgi:hypothetical protein